MNIRCMACIAVVVAGVSALAFTRREQPTVVPPANVLLAVEQVTGLQPVEKGREADLAAIQKSAHDFTDAFNKSDAKAAAALWTEQGECHGATGELIRGRAAIEKAFAEVFKENPKARIEVLIESVRFPAPEIAIEEGLLRQSGDGKDLPATTLYSVTHVRVGGQWQIAVSREWGAGEDRLEDLDWLVGDWKASIPGEDATLSISRDPKKPFLLGRFTRMDGKKEASTGTFRVARDPETGRLRSWHFDDDGGHGQALWVRDGNRWVLDSVGVLGEGTPTASVNIIGRVSADEITWRSIDRVLSKQPIPDTVPIKLTRVRAGK